MQRDVDTLLETKSQLKETSAAKKTEKLMSQDKEREFTYQLLSKAKKN